MPSKPLAFFVLVVSCMLAAGVGAFIATYQPARAVASTPSQSAEPAVTAPPQPIVAARPATTSAAPHAAASGAAAPAKSPSSPAAKGERRASPNPTHGRKSQDSTSKRAEDRSRTTVAANPQPDVPRATPPAAPLAAPPAAPPAGPPEAMTETGVDPNPQRAGSAASAQQPPVQQPPVAAGSGEPGRVEPEMARQEPARGWIEVAVPAESVIGLQLESTISTETARVEDPVGARVTRDVRVGGRVVIPAGTEAIGSVTLVERGGRVKERARLGFRFNTLVFPDQSRVAISTDTIYREGESPGHKSSAKIGGAAIGGAIVGAILGGGKGAAIGSGIGAAGGAAAAMAGDRIPAVVTAGTAISVRTQEPFWVPVDK
jgi:hypothetical protein